MRRLLALCSVAAACAAGAATDPLKDFQATVLKQCEAHFAGRPTDRMRQHASGDWIHTFASPASVAYDVKKTDSLVSPFAALIKIKWSEQNVRRKTEDEAKSATPADSAMTVAAAYELRYSFQQGKWVTTEGEVDMGFRSADQASFHSPIPPVKLSAADLRANELFRDCVR